MQVGGLMRYCAQYQLNSPTIPVALPKRCYNHKTMEYISLENHLAAFREHLDINRRAILSAKFGDGKTTFLKEFEEKYKEELFFITLHPVNYSVAENKDIFEYIKFDILTQLAECSLIEDIDSRTLWETAKKNLLTLDNVNSACDFLLELVPNGKVIRSVKDGVIALCKEHNLSKLFSQYQEEKATYEKYASCFKSQVGGLYEQDAYTVMIKCILKEIKPRTVLVVEDLDRMDPAHLFRLLNVFAAHIDRNGGENKFGFGNIILVLDYGVTENIFKHFYGAEANYNGYMSKFIEHSVFSFSIHQIAIEKVELFLTKECGLPSTKDLDIKENAPLRSIIQTKSVRDIAHALDNIEQQYKQEDIKLPLGDNVTSLQPIVKLLALLKRLGIAWHPYRLRKALECNDNVLQIVGHYLLVSGEMNFATYFSWQGKNWCLAKNDGQNGNTPFSFEKNPVGSSRRVEFSKLLADAIKAAEEHVVA